ncbi:MAG: DUF924 domain-containing protein [Bacteriovorax sp.]|nr:DUF924 domain-containing protein [Bacteriovorax sp.]
MNHLDIIDFWFEVVAPEQWFKLDEALDLEMTEKFIALHSSVVAGEFSYWRNEPLGRLAEILIIDQFSRNIYRDDPKSFLYDPMALALAQECIRGDFHKNLSPVYRQFLYMPFMHSESKAIHNTALLLYSEIGLEDNLNFELQHKEVIEKFGRFPTRNIILARQSTPEEIEYLKQLDAATLSEKSWQDISITQQTISVH